MGQDVISCGNFCLIAVVDVDEFQHDSVTLVVVAEPSVCFSTLRR